MPALRHRYHQRDDPRRAGGALFLRGRADRQYVGRTLSGGLWAIGEVASAPALHGAKPPGVQFTSRRACLLAHRAYEHLRKEWSVKSEAKDGDKNHIRMNALRFTLTLRECFRPGTPEGRRSRRAGRDLTELEREPPIDVEILCGIVRSDKRLDRAVIGRSRFSAGNPRIYGLPHHADLIELRNIRPQSAELVVGSAMMRKEAEGCTTI